MAERAQTGYPMKGDGFGTWDFLCEYQSRKAVNSSLEWTNRLKELNYTSDTYLEEFIPAYVKIINGLKATGAGITPRMQVDHLLTKLPSEYDTVKSSLAVLKGKQDPSLSKVFEIMRLVASQHPSLRISKHDKPNIKTYRGRDKSRGYLASGKQAQNSGFITNNNDKGNRSSRKYAADRSGSAATCWNCGKNGHVEKDCKGYCKIHWKVQNKKVTGHTRATCKLKQQYLENKRGKHGKPGTRNGTSNKSNNLKDQMAMLIDQTKKNAQQIHNLRKDLEPIDEVENPKDQNPNQATMAMRVPANISRKKRTRRIRRSRAQTQTDFHIYAKLDSGANKHWMPATADDRKRPVVGTVQTANAELSIRDNPKPKYVKGLDREIKFEKVENMNSQPLVSVYQTILSSGESKPSTKPVIFDIDGAYSIDRKYLKKGWNRKPIAVQNNGTYDIAMTTTMTASVRSQPHVRKSLMTRQQIHQRIERTRQSKPQSKDRRSKKESEIKSASRDKLPTLIEESPLTITRSGKQRSRREITELRNQAKIVDVKFPGDPLHLLHLRCNHYAPVTLLRAIRDGIVITDLKMPEQLPSPTFHCVGCATGKLTTRNTMIHNTTKSMKKLRQGNKNRLRLNSKSAEQPTSAMPKLDEILAGLKPYGYELAMDTVGPFNPPSLYGDMYGFIFHERTTSTVWIIFGRNKSDVEARQIGSQLRRDVLPPSMKVKNIYRLKSDGAGEYLSMDFVQNVADALGVGERKLTAPNSSYQNTRAERAIRTVTESAAAIMNTQRVPPSFWRDAYEVAVETRDMLPCHSNPRSYSPRQMRELVATRNWPAPVDLSWLRIPFTRVAYLDPPPRSQRYKGRGQLGIFVGYRRETRGYYVTPINIRTLKYKPSSTVLVPPSRIYFDERNPMPSTRALKGTITVHKDNRFSDKHFNIVNSLIDVVETIDDSKINALQNSRARVISHNVDNNYNDPPVQDTTTRNDEDVNSGSEEDHLPSLEAEDSDDEADDNRKTQGQLERPRRERRPTTKFNYGGNQDDLWKFYANLTKSETKADNGQNMLPGKPTNDRIKLREVLPLPRTVRQARKHKYAKQWDQAIEAETATLTEKFKTFGPEVPINKLPRNAKILYHKWVFTVNTEKNDKGEEIVTRFKARLCAVGTSQREGIDFDYNVFSPTPGWEHVRLVLAIAAKYNAHLAVFDISGAYLHADMDKVMYMTGLPWMTPGTAAQLLLALYGTKQAGNLWNKKFTKEIFSETGMKQSCKEPCIFYDYDENTNDFTIMVTWVDDGVLATTSKSRRDLLKSQLTKRLNIRKWNNIDSLGQSEGVLGGTLTKIKHGFHLSSEKNVNKLVETMNLSDVIHTTKGKSTPLTPGAKLTLEDEGDIIDLKQYPYRSGVGSISHLTNFCWPVLSYARSQLSVVLKQPKLPHWKELRRTVIYIGQNPDLGIVFNNNQDSKYPDILLRTDASFADCPVTGKSTSGYHIYYNNSIVAWNTKKEPMIATSTKAAELMAACRGGRSALSIFHLLQEILPPSLRPKVIKYEGDNTATNKSIDTLKSYDGTKHMGVKYMFMRQLYQEGILERPQYISTKENDADLATKAVNADQYNRLRPNVMQHLKSCKMSQL